MDVYSFNINPVPSPPNWKSSSLPPLIPPVARKQAGKTRKERKRAQDEPRKDSTRASKQGVTMTCGKCIQPDHNARTCKNPIHPSFKYHQGINTSRPTSEGLSSNAGQTAMKNNQVPSAPQPQSSTASIPRTASSQSVGRSRGRASSSARSRGASASARVRVSGRGVASAIGEVHVQGHGVARATVSASGIGVGRDGSNAAQGRPFNEQLHGLWDRYI